MEKEMDKVKNQLKNENYKEQFKRLNSALKAGYNLEAMFIEYAVLEDRTESVLLHANKWESYLKKRGRHDPTLNSKIMYIMTLMEANRKELLNRYFSDGLLNEILIWKEERNRLIHALLEQQLAHNEISGLALEGKRLAEELRNRAGNYNRAVDRKKAKDIEQTPK